MSKQVKIRIFPDGKIQAEVNGIKGKKCTKYINILEELLNSEVVDSDYTKEYFEKEEVLEEEDVQDINTNRN